MESVSYTTMKERQVAIVTDAGADLPSEAVLRNQFGIEAIPQIPLSVTFNRISYTFGTDLDNDLFKKLIHESDCIPKTAAISPYIIWLNGKNGMFFQPVFD